MRLLSLFVAIFLAGAQVAGAETLKRYNAPPSETSVSGISSGAFMAVQFGVAWSSIVKGVGVVAGGPYYCTQTSWLDAAFTGGAGPIFAATGPCMVGPPGDLSPLFKEADANAASGAIDPTASLARQKIYLFRGYNDAVVSKPVTDATAAFYRHYHGAAAANLFYQSAIGAGHSFVVDSQGQKRLDTCPANQAPYIDQCGYDQAGKLLQHIYGALNPPNTGSPGGKLMAFDQSAYTGDDIPDALSLADKGYLYVPADCAGGAACRVHVALHGCEQNAQILGVLFVSKTGYNSWADTNHLIVLYPQTEVSPFFPYNPKACWDWWGYVTFDDSYVTKSGKQIAAIKRMVDALTDPAAQALAPSGTFTLVANDLGDTSADLAWTAAAQADVYRVYRGTGGNFVAVGETMGLSFADSGLTPQGRYSWHVIPVVGGVEQGASNDVSGMTLRTPAPCDNPGSCPLP